MVREWGLEVGQRDFGSNLADDQGVSLIRDLQCSEWE